MIDYQSPNAIAKEITLKYPQLNVAACALKINWEDFSEVFIEILKIKMEQVLNKTKGKFEKEFKKELEKNLGNYLTNTYYSIWKEWRDKKI